MTKPDRLPIGSREEKIRAILEGSRYGMGHGYFVVKNPSQDAIDRGLSHHLTCTQEEQFFATNDPWCMDDFLPYKARFGTINLQRDLSQKLTYQIARLFPQIRSQV